MSGWGDSIIGLVCGYVDWERWRLVMFKAHVDESGKGESIFVVACLTATPGKWLAFAQDWETILRRHPAIPYFKFSEAVGKPWFDDKVPALIETVNRHVERGDMLAVNVGPYYRLFRGKVGATYDNPFHQGYASIMLQCLLELSRRSSHRAKVDFVFDDMDDTQFLELLATWKRLKSVGFYKNIKPFIGSEPVRRSDIDLLPLQGADLVAGLMRGACHGDGVCDSLIKQKLKITHRAVAWGEPDLARLFNGLNQAQIESGILYESGKERSKRLKSARKLLRENLR